MTFNELLFCRIPFAIGLLNSALKEIRNKRILSACSLFEKLPNLDEELSTERVHGDFQIIKADVKKVKEKKLLHILDLSDEIMIILNEIPLENITLSIFKYWFDLMIFEMMLFADLWELSKNLEKKVDAVSLKLFKFFFGGLIHFKKMDITILDAEAETLEALKINAEISKNKKIGLHTFKEDMLIFTIERIKNYETVQDLIDDSPTKECPVCLDVTFTESTEFRFGLNCNHLLCLNCATLLAEYNKLNKLVITSFEKLVRKYNVFLYFG